MLIISRILGLLILTILYDALRLFRRGNRVTWAIAASISFSIPHVVVYGMTRRFWAELFWYEQVIWEFGWAGRAAFMLAVFSLEFFGYFSAIVFAENTYQLHKYTNKKTE